MRLPCRTATRQIEDRYIAISINRIQINSSDYIGDTTIDLLDTLSGIITRSFGHIIKGLWTLNEARYILIRAFMLEELTDDKT